MAFTDYRIIANYSRVKMQLGMFVKGTFNNYNKNGEIISCLSCDDLLILYDLLYVTIYGLSLIFFFF